MFASAKLGNHGIAIRESVVGIGYVDFLVQFSIGLVVLLPANLDSQGLVF